MVRLLSSVRFRQGAQGGVAQLAEHTAHNRDVAGSSPAAATKVHDMGTKITRRPHAISSMWV